VGYLTPKARSQGKGRLYRSEDEKGLSLHRQDHLEISVREWRDSGLALNPALVHPVPWD